MSALFQASIRRGEPFKIGTYVQSGGEVLQCSEHGVWLRKGEERP